MKKIHIVLLVFIAGAIAVLISLLNTGSTYESIAEAKQNPGKFVHVAVQLDKSMPVEYDALKDANYLTFHAMDSTGQKMMVVYRKGEIPNLKTSERLVLQGRYEKDHFECKDVQTKCPSKYKDDMKPNDKTLQSNSTSVTNPAPNNSADNKY